jgi:hypothetical protein
VRDEKGIYLNQKNLLGKHKWEDPIKVGLTEIGLGYINRIYESE